MALSNYPVKAEALQLQGCSTVSLILDLLTSSVAYCYVSGEVEPTVSSISFLVSTLLVLTVGLGGQHCIVYSIKAIVFLNNGRRIFDIGEGNDMPTRKSMDAKMVVPCITFGTVETNFLYVPCDHQPLLWLGMQKGVSHVLHLGYGSVITPLPYGIETEKHVSLYESDSLSRCH
ncbi:hypothetical protein KY285_016780 [Solanum tuberosum]|nr:hypothetical protein KY285_016780 [Solanum tuberosum]